MTDFDRLTLTGLRAIAYHGVFEHERRDGQEFIIDVTLELPTAGASRDDDLEQTVHYGILAEEIVHAVERDPVNLIETVAARIADLVLAHRSVHAVTVTVHKPQAPITVPFADVSITIRRGRE